jgi:ribosomal protein S18 acetylase RimI-like enzyme
MVTTRPARDNDVDALHALAEDAYQHYTPRIGQPPAPASADYTDLVARGTTWVAESDQHVLGFIVLLEGEDHLLLENVAVDPRAQGRGIGSELLLLAEHEAQRRGHREIRLYTNEAMTENLDYYPRKGYVETHRGTQDGYRRVFFTKSIDPT